MARLLVVADHDPALFVELAETDDEEPCWDGPCSGCDWTAGYAGTRFPDLADAVHDALVHLDHQH